MVACIDRRLSTWDDGETRDMETEMRDLTLEILFATLFGRPLVPGEDQSLRKAADGLNEWFAPSSWMLPPWVPTPARRRFKQSKNRIRQEVRALLEEDQSGNPENTPEGTDETSLQEQRHAATPAVPDLLSQLHRARNAEGSEHLSTQEIEDQLVTMVFAGHETTAAALGFAWYLLATHPDIRDRFHEELDEVLGGNSPSTEDLSELEFTDQLLTEALRLYPPVHKIRQDVKRR
jgi:cytochrome P450